SLVHKTVHTCSIPASAAQRNRRAVRRAGGARSVVQLFDAGTQIQLVDEGQILLGRQLPAAARHGDEQRLDDVGGEGAAGQLGRGGDQEAPAALLQLVPVLLRTGLGDDGFAREIVGHVAENKLEVAGVDVGQLVVLLDLGLGGRLLFTRRI